MNRVQPIIIVPQGQVVNEQNPHDRNDLIQARRPIHLVDVPYYDGSKLFRILFVVQILSVIFTTDAAFYPVHAYGCNPYSGLTWNETTQTEYFYYCSNCSHEQERRAIRSIACHQRCEKYKHGLKLLHDESGTATPATKRNISQLYLSTPNPLCFEWDDVTSNLYDPNLKTKKFNSKKSRAETYDDYLNRAYIYSYVSFLILMCWIVLYTCRCHFAQFGCKVLTTFMFIISFMIFYLSIHLGYHVLQLFTCYQRIATYDKETGDFIKFEFEPYCKSSFKIPNATYIYEDDVYEFLPEMPPSWTMSYFIWIMRALTPAALISYWFFRSYIGLDLMNSLYYPCLYVVAARMLRRIRRIN